MVDIVRSGAEILSGPRPPETRWTSVAKRSTASSLIDIVHRPKFRIAPNAPIFTMGSCFTRVVENALIGLGRNVLLQPFGLPIDAFERRNSTFTGTRSRTCFNKYDVHAMSHEIRRVLDNKTYENEGLIEIGPDRWFDPHASMLRPTDLATALRNRQHIKDATAQIRKAAVVILTLGLTESWVDTATGLAMNVAPPPQWLASNSGRFQFIDHGYESILSELLDTIDFIRRNGNNAVKFILTVSPIPMAATFRALDILVAHTASKAVLRAVADEAQRRLDHVDYFPAYELVVHSSREVVWQQDNMHVESAAANHVVGSFCRAYGLDAGAARPSGPQSTQLSQRAQITAAGEVAEV